MTTLKPRNKTVRKYKKDTFKNYQDEKVSEREQSIDEILVLLGKSSIKFPNITKLADHVSELLIKEGQPCSAKTLIRKHSTKYGAEAPNPYRLLLQKYELGKYFVKNKNLRITSQDIEETRRKFPAVDAYCSLKDGEAKNFQDQVKHLSREVARLQEGKTLPQESSSSSGHTDQLDMTVTALKRLVDASEEFYEIDWKKRAIVDISHRIPKVVVESDLLSVFFSALENSGMKPPEGT